MWKRFKKAWAIYRHVSAVRGLLQWLGSWKYIVAIFNTIVALKVAHWASLTGSFPPPIIFLIGLACFALLVFLAGLVTAFLRVSQEPKENPAESVSLDARLGHHGEERWPALLLQTGKAADALVVWIENRADHSMEQCALFLQQMQHYSEATRMFTARNFSGVYLVRPQQISARGRTDSGQLAYLPNLQRDFLTTPDAADKLPPVITREPGIWKATINVIAANEMYAQEDIHFKWERGAMPELVKDPTHY